ncbi:CBS domain-containing protein [Nocardioides dubius]|uniref:CBS domain-containing protein n=1 Tax=Nocardioides dubius TaxID=317019 RepID=A0ABN1TJQ1_9ACTN
MRISDVLRGKAESAVVTIAPGASVRDLVALLAEHNVGALIVSSEPGVVAGIVSERDVVRHLHANPSVLDARVLDIMTPTVHTCTGADAVTDLMQLMTEHRVRHVPVLTDGRLSGIVSIGDVVKSRIGELEFERDQLDHYLHQN